MPTPLSPSNTAAAQRAHLVIEHLEVADSVARRYRRNHQDWVDIQQVARMGLVKAASRYRCEDGNNFVAFAVPTIAGEIKRYLRDHSWMIRPPRPVQELRARVNATTGELGQQLGREPTSAELAASLEADSAAVQEAQQCHSSMHPDSLDSQPPGGECAALYETLSGDDNAFDRIDDRVSLAAAMRELTPWERRLLYLRFFEDRKQQEIADELGISQMQVSRILVRLLDRLRGRLTAE
jgi:RNA polymerase sigma-B factor